MKILIVEDEEKAARFLRQGLVEQGFSADMLHDGPEGLLAAQGGEYDLLIVDVVLPGITGLQLVHEYRRTGGIAPIILLTSRDGVQDRIRGIEGGANVYLVKPYSFAEVLAYVRSLTRRLPPTSDREAEITIGDLEIDFRRQTVRRNGNRVELTAKEFCLLSLLTRHPGQVLSRSVIADRVWGMNFDPGTNVVDVHIRRLRAKLDDPYETKLIRTVRGTGYTLDDPADLS